MFFCLCWQDFHTSPGKNKMRVIITSIIPRYDWPQLASMHNVTELSVFMCVYCYFFIYRVIYTQPPGTNYCKILIKQDLQDSNCQYLIIFQFHSHNLHIVFCQKHTLHRKLKFSRWSLQCKIVDRHTTQEEPVILK